MRECEELHYMLNNLKRHAFPFDKREIQENGIYVLFENGESGHGVDRIVRVGTHTGERQLLSKDGDPFLEDWELDLTSRENREKYLSLIDMSKLKKVEKTVSSYIQSRFSFITFEAEGKERRLWIEAKIISTVSWCDCCKPSSAWLGLNSPKKKIRESGLWLVNQLYKELITPVELTELRALVN